MLRKNRQMWIVLVAVIAVAVVGCNNPVGSDGGAGGGSGDGTSDGTLTINGMVDYSGVVSGAATEKSLVQSLMSTEDADTIMAVPIRYPFRADREVLEDAKTEPIAEDGSFSISLDAQYDWVVMLLDTEQPSRKEQFVAFVGLEDDNDVLIRMPISDAQEDVDAGTITIDADSMVAYETGSLLTNSDGLGLSHSELREIARTDNLVKTIKNIYVNAGPDSPEMVPLLVYNWQSELTDNTWSNPSSYIYEGVTVDFDYANPEPPVTFDSVYPDETVTVELPNDTEYTGSNWVEDDSDGDRGASDDDGKVAIFEYTSPYEIFRISVREPVGATEAVPDGFWNVIVNDSPVSHYDVAGSEPIYRQNGETETLVYVPSAHYSDAASDTTQLEIQWQVYNPSSGTYESVSDLSRFDSIVSYMAIGYEAKDDTPGGNIDMDDQTQTQVEIPLSFDNIDDVSITYRVYGYDFRVLFSSNPQ